MYVLNLNSMMNNRIRILVLSEDDNIKLV